MPTWSLTETTKLLIRTNVDNITIIEGIADSELPEDTHSESRLLLFIACNFLRWISVFVGGSGAVVLYPEDGARFPGNGLNRQLQARMSMLGIEHQSSAEQLMLLPT